MNQSTLITTVRQSDGSTREIHAQDAAHATKARRILRDDPTMIDHLRGVDGIKVATRDV